MSTRTSKKHANKASATKRTGRIAQGVRGDSRNAELKRRDTDVPGTEVKAGRRKTDAVVRVESVPPRSRREEHTTIGGYVCHLIGRNKSTEEILDAVGKRFPDALTSRGSVAWYRSKLNKQGKA